MEVLFVYVGGDQKSPNVPCCLRGLEEVISGSEWGYLTKRDSFRLLNITSINPRKAFGGFGLFDCIPDPDHSMIYNKFIEWYGEYRWQFDMVIITMSTTLEGKIHNHIVNQQKHPFVFSLKKKIGCNHFEGHGKVIEYYGDFAIFFSSLIVNESFIHGIETGKVSTIMDTINRFNVANATLFAPR